MDLRPVADRSVFDAFVQSSLYCHYMKTSMWGEFRKRMDGLSYELLGFYNGNDLVGTAMVLKGSWLGHSYLYIPKGPCIDYENTDLRKQAFSLLKNYADCRRVQFLRIDPNVNRVPHDLQGKVLDGYNHEDVTEDLKALDYLHKGYGYAYNGSWSNRFTLIVDLSPDMDEIVRRFSKQRHTSLNRHVIEHVSTRIGSKADVPTLMRYEQHLSWQDGFPPHKKEFFESIMDLFGEHAVLYVTEIDLQAMADGIKQELEGKKYRKDPEARAAKEKELKKAQLLETQYGGRLPIAAGLFLRMGTWSWDLYTYNHKEFSFIQSVDNLHRFAMADMKAHGVLHYDMCGFSGVTTPDDYEYGLYLYKSSFAPEYIEQIGEFDYVRTPAAMKRFRFEKLALNHVKRKVWASRYKKNAASSDYISLQKKPL